MTTESVSVAYGETVLSLTIGDVLSFGRGSDDLDLGDDPMLHRNFGRIFWRVGGWWLHNEGSRLALSIHDRTSLSSIKLAAGREVSLSFPESVVRFTVGEKDYEICIKILNSDSPPKAYAPRPSDPIDTTVDQLTVPLAADQRLLLVALAADKLRNPHDPMKLPTNKSVARRLGWTSAQFNRKLDRMCQKFARNGVDGLVGDAATLATNRRRRLVEHAIEAGLVASSDLDLLSDYPE